MEPLTPEQELAFMREVQGSDDPGPLLARITDSFNVLQVRAATLLSLAALCLTITGFSGPRIAESGVAARWALGIGLVSAVLSALILVCGPFRLRWVTRWRAESVDATLCALLEKRNQRTRRYQLAATVLVVGLAFYVAALVIYLGSL